MHEKALLTASVFGLPMFSINMGGTRDTTAAGGSQVTTNNTLGVTSGDLALTNTQFQVPAAPVSGPNGTTYFTGRDGVASNPGEPALPRYVANVDVPNKVLRGVGFRSGAFTETTGVKPFIGAPGTEFGGAQTPFTSTTFYPSRMWTASYFAELSGGATSLVVTPAQHRVATVGDSTAIRRLFASLGLRLFYADANDADAALATAPAISDVGASLAGSTVTFSARVHGTECRRGRQPQDRLDHLQLRRDRLLMLAVHRADPQLGRLVDLDRDPQHRRGRPGEPAVHRPGRQRRRPRRHRRQRGRLPLARQQLRPEPRSRRRWTSPLPPRARTTPTPACPPS